MDKFLKQLNSLRDRIEFDAQRKQQLRNRLVREMHERPRVLHRRWWSVGVVQFAGAFFSLLIILGATTSYAASQALPGDFLYPVKVKVNEPVAGVLQRTPEAKAAWEIERASKRLEEVDQLALNNKLDVKANEVSEQSLNRQIERVQARIQRVEDDGNSGGAVELQSNLTAVFSAHERVLDNLDQEHGAGNKGLEAAKLNIRARIKANAERQIKKDEQEQSGKNDSQGDKQNQNGDNEKSKTDSDSDKDNKSDSGSDNSDNSKNKARAQDLLRRAGVTVNSTNWRRSGNDGDFNHAQTFLESAKRALDDNKYDESLSLSRKGLEAAQEARILNSLNSRFHLNIGGNSGQSGQHN